VWVIESLDENVSGSGSVTYYVNPSTNPSSSGSGMIKSMGERLVPKMVLPTYNIKQQIYEEISNE
jgi:hypothetical protein